MKTLHALLATSAVSFLAFSQAVAEPNVQSTVVIGARSHIEHTSFEDLPFDGGDLTYSLGFEWHEKDAYWQICLGYSPKPSRTNDVEYVLTPEVNLMISDNYWRGGIGAVWSYVERKGDSPTKSDWLDVYWQFIFGFSMPLGGMHLDLMAYYVFQDWDKLDEFDLNDIEFGAWLGYNF
jgi:hypothetical protein